MISAWAPACLLPQVMVLADASLEEAKRLDALCHAHGVKFIWAQCRGVFASVFNDFGPEFTVFDVDGARQRARLFSEELAELTPFRSLLHSGHTASSPLASPPSSHRRGPTHRHCGFHQQ